VLAFFASLSVVAMALVFLGGAVYRESFELGLALAAVGGGWLGILYASLTNLASRDYCGQVNSTGGDVHVARAFVLPGDLREPEPDSQRR